MLWSATKLCSGVRVRGCVFPFPATVTVCNDASDDESCDIVTHGLASYRDPEADVTLKIYEATG